MSQHLADLGQRDPSGDHVAGQGVPQPMRPNPGHTRPDAGASHDGRHATAAQSADRSTSAHEQGPAGRLGATQLQIAHDRFPNVGGQRQLLLPITFAVDQHLTAAPVNVVNGERCDLS